jgi:hypothetical protein
MVDEVNGVKAEIVADPGRLGDALPAVVGLPQERAEADGTGRGAHLRARSGGLRVIPRG